MIYHEVENQAHAAGMAGFDERFNVGDCAVWWVYGFVVGDVVAHVVLWGVVHWGEPDDVDAEGADVVDFGDDAGDVAQAVTVGVGVGGGVDLVDCAIFPPGARGDCHFGGIELMQKVELSGK